MAKNCASLFHAKCMAIKVSLADATDIETKNVVINEAKNLLTSHLEAGLTNREHGAAIAKHFDEMTASVLNIGLPGDSIMSIIELMEKINAEELQRRKGWCMQDYLTMFQYFDNSFWQIVSNKNVPLVEAMWYQRAIALGCRNPSERTTQIWTAFFIAVHITFEQCVTLHPGALKSEQQRVKAAFKNMCKTAEAPSEEVGTLPSDPTFLKSQFPETFNVVFADFDTNPPVICPFPLTLVNKISTLWKCRGQGSSLHSGVSSAQTRWYGQSAVPALPLTFPMQGNPHVTQQQHTLKQITPSME